MKFLKHYRLPVLGLATLILTEIGLRTVLGLGNPVLYQADSETGYRVKPNQNLVRFGKQIQYNNYSQRNRPIAQAKAGNLFRILMVGDSVLNGGNLTDQAQTITALLEKQIQQQGKEVEVLNASTGGWGVGNEFGYLRKFGIFQSDVTILQIGTNDFDQSDTKGTDAENNPNSPFHPPLFAIQELLNRYILPSLKRSLSSVSFRKNSATASSTPLLLANTKQFEQNMETLKRSVFLIRHYRTPVCVLYVPDRDDLVPTARISPNQSRFFQSMNALNVPVIDVYQAWSALPAATVKTYFRDNFHPNEAGNQAIANLLQQSPCIQGQKKP